MPVYCQADSVISDTTSGTETVFRMSKSPWLAVGLSAVFPGAGQIYNESYYKAPVIWGVAAWLVYLWIDNNDLYKTYRDLFIQTNDARFKDLRTFYQDQRDEISIYLGLVYLLNLIDAYVDAQLFDFTVDEDFLTGSHFINLRINLQAFH
ncbi:MAG: hypothetical protein Kow0098_28460 [Ignavibacteriaceae bacterium]